MSTLRVENITDLGDDPVVTAGRFTSDVLPAGSVLQVVSTVKTNGFSTSSSSYVDITGLSATITPSSISSKIMVLIALGAVDSAGINGIFFNLKRNSTSLESGQTAFAVQITSANGYTDIASMNYLDSPSSTSALTYQLQMKIDSTTGYINQRSGGGSYVSTITLMEIAG